MPELEPWPYGPLPPAREMTYGAVRIVVEATEDGFYGFAFRRGKELARMIGPHETAFRCERATRFAIPPGVFGD